MLTTGESFPLAQFAQHGWFEEAPPMLCKNPSDEGAILPDRARSQFRQKRGYWE